MYLHLGNDVLIHTEDILFVCDLDNTSWSSITREFLAKAEKDGLVVATSSELPKSFIVCSRPSTGQITVYLSQLNPATLVKRSESAFYE